MALFSRLPAGLLYRGHTARLLLVTTLALAGSITLLYPVATALVAFVAVRAVSGLTYGVATTVNLAYFVEELPPERDRSQAMAFYAGALATGFAIGNGPGGLIVDWFGYTAGFVFASGLYFVALAAALLRRPSQAARPRAAAPAEAPGSGTYRAQLRAAAGDPGTRAVTLAAFLLAFLISTLSTYMTLYALAVNITLTEVGFIRSAFSVLQAVMRSLAGPPIRRLGHRRVQDGGVLGQAVCIALVPNAASFWPLLAVVLATGVCRAVAFVANNVGLAQEVDERRVSRGVASGLFTAATDLGQIVGPAVSGAVAEVAGLEVMFRVVPLLLVALYAAAMLGSRRPAQRPRPGTGRPPQSR
jgi:MFS family permease